jgi:branched-subunit amino acid ABC-type transport system permease component
MDISLFSQLLTNGIIIGAIYALVASGFSLMYTTCKFINFAHGAVITFSAYTTYFFFSVLGINFGFSVLLALVFASLLGWAMNFFIYRKFRKRHMSNSVLLIASFCLLILLESLILIAFGADIKTIDYLKVSKGIELLGIIITPLQIVIVVSSILIFSGLFLFMKKTKLGKAMRAVSNDKDVAELMGISSERIYSWSCVISSLIAGVAGVLIGLEQNLSPTMGTNLIIKGFTAAIICGIGNIYGVILGALILGLAENFGIWYLPSSYKDAIAFVILFIFLLFKPKGLFGTKKDGDKE